MTLLQAVLWFAGGFVVGALAAFAALYVAANLDNPESWWGRR